MQDERLIECVRSREFLYDYTHTHYMDTKYKSIAWREIAEELNQPAALCKSRWQNIRDQFRKYRIKHNAGRGGSTPDTYRKYKFEDMLQFLTPHFQEREMHSSFEYVDTGEYSGQATNRPPPSSLSSSSSPHNFEIEADHSDNGAGEIQPPQKKKKTLGSEEQRMEQQRMEQEMSLGKNITDCTEILKRMVQAKTVVETPRTPMQQFFDGVAASVSQLRRKYQSIAKRKIIEIVTELEEMEDENK
ncbi:uncharacterized protein LOC143360280 [Halictus rubicundus]|uniref:uncharacterized protein LOC143360280 n=1 Tax=Halictus rubicundus TaxID=77578 RepID=UPI004035EEEF